VASLREGNSNLLNRIDLSITARLVDSGSRRRSLPFVKKAIENGVHRVAPILLQKLESGNPLPVKYDNLAIEKQGDGLESADGRGNSREFIRAVFLLSGEQADPIIFLISEDPVGVVLLLVGPPGPVE
jgi:hypothetical protein